jgi:hypothetical protein
MAGVLVDLLAQVSGKEHKDPWEGSTRMVGRDELRP